MSARLKIDRLGAVGDGIANTERGAVYVPFALPGEEVNVALEKDRGTLIAVLEPSPARIEPSCRHFTECGGCTLQHLRAEEYRAFKHGRVADVLRRERIEIEPVELVTCKPTSRRRVTLSARKTFGGMVLGYHRMSSAQIIEIEECPIAEHAIIDRLPTLRALAAIVCQTDKPFHITVTNTNTGLDVAFAGSGKLPDAARREAGHFAMTSRFDRLTVDGEIIVEPVKPVINFGSAKVSPPPGGFLQAVAASEAAMARLVTEHLGKAKRVADLFAGAGAFALRLAAKSEVHAVESDQAALVALDKGFRLTPGLRRVTTEKRDLFRRPLTFKELAAFDGLVFDPPRAGAEDQCKQIARSDVPLVAAVSCNPTTLGRDLRILVDGGYSVKSVTPVDQFLWTGHVEAVALLTKPKKRR